MIRRAARVTAVGVAIATTLSGCIFPYDVVHPEVVYSNLYDQPGTVFLGGTSTEIVVELPSPRSNATAMDECPRTGIRVETEHGDVPGRVDKPACEGWLLTIKEVGTVDNAER